MTITRDVIFDLLPAYFAGEVSADTRALVDEFLRTDPEFARMATRFHNVMNERPSQNHAARERATFERVRALIKRRNQAFGGATAYGLAALLTLFVANPLRPPMPTVLVFMTLAFVGIQLICWVVWLVAVRSLQNLRGSV